MSVATKLCVVRHANIEKKLDRVPELWPLSPTGKLRTTELARREEWKYVKKLYHSPELKSRQTAEIISEITGIPVQPLWDLRDVTSSVMPNSEVTGSLLAQEHYVYESATEATERIVNCIRTVMKSHWGQEVGIISSDRVLALLYAHILKRKISLLEWLNVSLPGLSVIDVEHWKITRGFCAKELEE